MAFSRRDSPQFSPLRASIFPEKYSLKDDAGGMEALQLG